MDLSFSGAGFMGCYYFGVIDCWLRSIPRDRINRVAGASAGSLIAATYLLDLPLNKALRSILELSAEFRRRPLGVFDRSYQMVDQLPIILDKIFPEDAHKRVSGKLHVAMTRAKDLEKVVVNEFETRKDLIDALNCSCFIPVWSGNHTSTYKDEKHFDGGLSDNLPVFDEHTIRVCCFSGATDISPYDKSRKNMLSGNILNTPLYFTFANLKRGRRALFPPPASYILSLLKNGYHDTKTFILDNDLIQCDKCWNNNHENTPIYSSISPSISSAAISRRNSSLNLSELGNNSENNSQNNSNRSSRKGSDLMLARNNSLTNHNNKPDSIATFNELLRSKLSKCSPSPDSDYCSSQLTTSPTNTDFDANNNNPTIVINCVSSLEEPLNSPNIVNTNSNHQKASSNLQINEKRKRRQSCDSNGPASKDRRTGSPFSGGQKAFQERRNTLFNSNNNESLVMKDKFKLSPEPLPSCPPSPNLNRNCSECARLRQEARCRELSEEILRVVEDFLDPEQISDGFKSKLTNPIRWFKQLGQKSSYKFESLNEISAN